MRQIIVALFFLLFAGGLVLAGEVVIVKVNAQKIGTSRHMGLYRFDVTLKHADSGWDHYADGWEVLGPDGKVLGKRTLLHPHVNEQPFTRSLSGVKVPTSFKTVSIRAHDKLHGYGKAVVQVELSAGGKK